MLDSLDSYAFTCINEIISLHFFVLTESEYNLELLGSGLDGVMVRGQANG